MVDLQQFLVVACDPGPGFGVAAWDPVGLDIENYDLVSPIWTTTWNLGYDGHALLHDKLHSTLRPSPNRHLHLIYEPFEHRPTESDRNKIDYTAAEYVGVIKLVFATLVRFSSTRLVRQSASLGPGGFWDNDKLARIGLYHPGQTRHARDALRHLLHYMTTNLHWQYPLELLRDQEPTVRGKKRRRRSAAVEAYHVEADATYEVEVDLPWSNPNADPLQDIQKAKKLYRETGWWPPVPEGAWHCSRKNCPGGHLLPRYECED